MDELAAAKRLLLGIALVGLGGPAHANILDRQLQQQRTDQLQQQRDKATQQRQDIQWRQLLEEQKERINKRQEQIDRLNGNGKG